MDKDRREMQLNKSIQSLNHIEEHSKDMEYLLCKWNMFRVIYSSSVSSRFILVPALKNVKGLNQFKHET